MRRAWLSITLLAIGLFTHVSAQSPAERVGPMRPRKERLQASPRTLEPVSDTSADADSLPPSDNSSSTPKSRKSARSGSLRLVAAQEPGSSKTAERVGPVRTPKSASATADAQAGDAATGKLRESVDRPIAVRRLDSRIQITEARVQAHRRQLATLDGFNQNATPGSAMFLASQVLPPAPGITPVMTGQPVQLFHPASTFAHVLSEEQTQLERAELQLATLRTQKQQLESRTGAPDEAAALSYEDRVNQVRQTLELAEFNQRAAQTQADRFAQLNRLTYSNSYSDLGDLISLDLMEWNLAVDDLHEELRLLGQYRTNERPTGR